jgi:hypothetical protein
VNVEWFGPHLDQLTNQAQASRERLDVPSPSTVTHRTSGIQYKVSDLSCSTVRTSLAHTVDDETCAYATAHRHVSNDASTGTRTDQRFGNRSSGSIIFQKNLTGEGIT